MVDPFGQPQPVRSRASFDLNADRVHRDVRWTEDSPQCVAFAGLLRQRLNCLHALPCPPDVSSTRGRNGADEQECTAERDGIEVVVRAGGQGLSRLHRDVLGALSFAIGKQHLSKVPLGHRQPQRIVCVLAGTDRTIRREQRDVHPAEPLGDAAQQRIQVSSAALNLSLIRC